MQPNVAGESASITATYFLGARGPEYRRDDTKMETDSQGHSVTKARWYVYDGLGSVVGEVDPAGNLTSSPKYDVYGAVRANSGTATSRQGFVGSLGHVSDDTGLVYMQARYYDPTTGRFASQDVSHDGVNWFAYCDNNPVNRFDRDGKLSEAETTEAIRFFAGVLLLYAWALITAGCSGVSAGMAMIRYGEALSALGEVVSGISPAVGSGIMLFGAGTQIAGAGSAISSAAGVALGLTVLSMAW